jgi:hypothetical protein
MPIIHLYAQSNEVAAEDREAVFHSMRLKRISPGRGGHQVILSSNISVKRRSFEMDIHGIMITG